jgi:hypothetical protein
MTSYIVDQPDKIALRDELGHDVAWDSFDYGDATDEQKAEFEAGYEIVKNGSDSWFHTDGDLYQGSTLMRVIRRKADGKLFGFEYWEGGGKHGETYIESNGDEKNGFPNKYDWEDGVDEDEIWYVFQPVEYAPLPAYKISK